MSKVKTDEKFSKDEALAVGERLKQARKAAKKSQEKVALAVGMTQGAYSSLERGRYHGSKYIVMIADFLGVNPIWLMTGRDSAGQNAKNSITGDGIAGDMNDVSGGVTGVKNIENTGTQNTAYTTTNNYYNTPAPSAEMTGKRVGVWSDGDIVPDGMVAISYYKPVAAALGSGYINDDYIEEEELWFRRDTISECNVNEEAAKVIKVRGDSMIPDLMDGQVIAIDTSATRIYDGEIYVIRVGDELKAKYLFKHGTGFKAVSRNDDKLRYPDEIYTLEDIESNNIEIIGQYWWKSETKKIRR
ncbi:XRE family transcriptional regulator [Moraxella sp.]|uniref:XRE family transcriptional regulator n=1 Tax=Moraxella sp. TaxID=479 RepID=UPI0026DD5D2B|nr:XRE family transcriptional regulator [Moraxella sp.]MDO4894996.1 XRE family transcriptional regulator [Moraxella sp.]